MKILPNKRNINLIKAMINKKSKTKIRSLSMDEEKLNKNTNQNKHININNIQSSDFNNVKIQNEIDLAEKIYKANLLKIKENQIEDEEINSLNEKIHDIMIKNYTLQKKIQTQLNQRLTYEKNQKEIASYINDLNYKFHNYDETINKYESMMKKLRRENQKLTNEYDKKIEIIEKENNKLKKRVQDRIELYLHQKGEIEEKTIKSKNLEKEIKDQEGLIKVRVEENKLKLKELEEKYDLMYKKVINLEVNLEDQKLIHLFESNLYTIDEINVNNNNNLIYKKDKNKNTNNIDKKNDNNNEGNEIKDINNKIEDYENNNEALLYELTELNKKYENLIMNKRKKNKKEKKQNYTFQSTNRTTTSNLNTYINKETQRSLNDNNK